MEWKTDALLGGADVWRCQENGTISPTLHGRMFSSTDINLMKHHPDFSYMYVQDI
jgi:hypothetical protein